ncbi:MAG TPA: hypothetical protein VI168_02705 [Croceibacterium sp.]
MTRKLGLALAAGFVVLAGSEAANEITDSERFSLVSPAHAVVGRPLTPVSVAGVARRTARRCAAGVYNC